jgi:hypothetical protein
MAALLTFAPLAGLAGAAEAQVRRSTWGGAVDHKFELGAHGGYVWTFSQDAYYGYPYAYAGGDVDIKDSGMFGFTGDFVVRSDAQVELLYNRQNSTLTFEQYGTGVKTDVGSMATEYFHIGGLGGRRKGKSFPYGMFTLGATRYSTDYPDVDDEWRFSMILGLGAKYYPGGRLSLRVQGRLPVTFGDGGYGTWCGGGGCYTSVGGAGYTQFDVSGGASFLF